MLSGQPGAEEESVNPKIATSVNRMNHIKNRFNRNNQKRKILKALAMRIRYDEKVDALYIRLRESKYHENDEIKEGFILDYDKEGNIIGIEILDASSYLHPSELSSVSFDINRTIESESP